MNTRKKNWHKALNLILVNVLRKYGECDCLIYEKDGRRWMKINYGNCIDDIEGWYDKHDEITMGWYKK